ncbi:recombinase family protein [Flavobacterium quisquiliarum]|uniref:Recombinase family protein n=1 Tax=Flavobacterium quisquiliarum TaxID=1834436 RepID=A0ABV8W837_9FLAO|nr:recombinase family protein [Flavobacterium quisquiliarum]MBW1656640.1 recombinase family protein [Flavobacterium quisquiliarum]
MKKAIILVRVSTSEQDFQAQIQDLKYYGHSLGYKEFHIIETKETAFADLNQKIGTTEMFNYIERNPEYNTVLTTEISRLARRQSILHSIKEWCLNQQIQIYIKDLDFKLLDESGKITQQAEMIFTLFGLFAESEVKQKLERFQRKRKELMQLGLSISGKLLFGYNRMMTESEKNTLVINESQATIVRTIFNWYLNGLENVKNPSIKTISLECIKRGFHSYTHSKRNVNKLLKEQAYTGEKTTNNKRKNPKFGIVLNESEYLTSANKIRYPVIIEKEIFNKVQDKLKSNITQGDKQTKHITLLSKLINCPSCGRKLQGNYRINKGEQKNSYRCTSRGDSKPCSSTKSLSMNLIDSAVWSLIKADLPALSKVINEINPDKYLSQLENHLQNFIARENDIKNGINENIEILKSVRKLRSSNILELIDATAKKIENLESELNKIQQEKSKIESNKLLIYDKQSNVESVITDNLQTIEGSKELLKKYINSFIYSINIIEHNVKHTVLEIVLRDYSYSSDILKIFPILKDAEYIILDKTVTRQIKGAYYRSNLSSSIYTNHSSLSLGEVASIIKNELRENKLEIGTDLKFNKLQNL